MNQELCWLAVPIAILLVLLFLYKEWKGKFETRFFINSIMASLAIASLLFLYLRPTVATEVSGKAILLTKNYSPSQLDSVKNIEKSIRTIRYEQGLDLSKSLDSITEVIVLGNGLPTFDFWQLEDVSTTYLKGTIPEGVIKLKYENKLRIGDDLAVSGLYNKPASGNRLVLQTVSGYGLDSIVFKDDSEQGFKLNSSLKTKGKYVYQLIEKDSTGTVLNSNPLPVVVLEKERLRIFICNTFPSFETKYLKNFLAEEGHELVVRSQITKGRYKFEYFNTGRSPVYGFNENDLKKFDLVILDTETYLSLSKNNGVVMKLVKDLGVGVFVQPNESLFKVSNAMVDFGIERDASQKSLKVESNIIEKYPYRFKNTNPSGIAVENHSYAMVIGNGKFSTTVLSNTYQLVLDGETEVYRSIWSRIIATSAKEKEATGAFAASEYFYWVDKPNSFSLQTATVKPTVTVDGQYNSPLIKNPILEDGWHGTTYPNTTGWHALQIVNDTSVMKNYFVMDTIHWKSLTAIRMITENTRFFDKTGRTLVKKMVPKEVNRWWFFLVFLGSIGFLWLFPKLKTL